MTKSKLSATALLPTNLLSYTTGVASRAHLPHFVQAKLNRGFIRAFNIDMSEAEKPVEAYATIEDIFTRALKPVRVLSRRLFVRLPMVLSPVQRKSKLDASSRLKVWSME